MKFEQAKGHELACNCSYCCDVDPNKSVSRELERHIEELTAYAAKNLDDDHQKFIHLISAKILLLRRYFPTMELPSKHERLVASIEKNNKDS